MRIQRLSALGLFAFWLSSCAQPQPAAENASSATGQGPLFIDRAHELGLDFVHFNGMTGAFLYPEMMGSGCALFDYDGDGDLDLYLVQGGRLGGGEPLFPYRGEEPPSDRLYRNDLSRTATGERDVRLVDVTAKAGGLSTGYGMGVAVGDIDVDGFPDLYVTNLGANILLRNLGDGRFSEVTAVSGTADDGWGVPAVFFDFDDDRLPDLYLGNYVDYAVSGDRECFATTGARDYCGPTAYPAARDRLFRNRGDGRFEDISVRSGVGRRGRTLGAVAADLDGDGRLDLYVANDGEPNFLWLNRVERFEDGALPAGVAVDGEGRPQASMGVEVADLDADGDEDLLVTHLSGETHALYLNEGGGRFAERSRASGLGGPSLPMTGFGTAAIDFDADGHLDLLTLNGAVKRLEALVRLGDTYPLAQPKQLYRNLGGARFEEVTAVSGLGSPRVGRGAAAGDVDNDGDLDVLVNNNSGAAEILMREPPSAGSWVGLILPGGRGRARVERGELAVVRTSRVDGSYASSRDSRLLLGLGAHRGPVDVRIESGGRRRLLRSVPSGRYLLVHR